MNAIIYQLLMSKPMCCSDETVRNLKQILRLIKTKYMIFQITILSASLTSFAQHATHKAINQKWPTFQ